MLWAWAMAVRDKMPRALLRAPRRLLAFGTKIYPPKIARRLKVLNGMAGLIVIFSAQYALSFALADFDRYQPFIWLNIALVVMGLAVPFMHRFGEIAGGMLITVTELLALFAFTALLGRNTGIQLNLIVGAAAPFFILGLKRPIFIASIVLATLCTHTAAWFLFPPEKALISADPFLIDQLYISSAFTTFGVIAALVWYAFALVEEAEAAAEELLRNVLPSKIVDRLTARPGRPLADSFPEISVLFTDLQGFVPIAKALGARRTVAMLNHLVRAFDALADKHGVEKVKTIGDAYMAVAGAPEPAADHVQRMARFALDLRIALEETAQKYHAPLKMRIGIASGPVMAGVIGTRRFSYDVWGDAVNLAARLESSGEAGRIHINDTVYRRLAGDNESPGREFAFTPRGHIDIKGFGMIESWFLEAAVPVKA